jgi:hypothetical protein
LRRTGEATKEWAGAGVPGIIDRGAGRVEGRWEHRKKRSDPLYLLAMSNKGRQNDLVLLRTEYIASSPFAFLRGS